MSGTHQLSRIVPEGRAHERHVLSVPCRLSFTRRGLREVECVLAMTRNISCSGVLIAMTRPLGDVSYLGIELAPGEAPLQSVVRRVNGLEVGAEFLVPIEAQDLIALLHRGR